MLSYHQIIVPVKSNPDIVKAMESTMNDMFGHADVKMVNGYWVGNNNSLTTGKVAIVSAFTETNYFTRRKLRKLAKLVLDNTDQTAVMIADGKGAEIVTK